MPRNPKPVSGLWRNNPETPEGKYLVKRRDGTVPEWPSFVLGLRGKLKALERKNERLRAALQELVDKGSWSHDDPQTKNARALAESAKPAKEPSQ